MQLAWYQIYDPQVRLNKLMHYSNYITYRIVDCGVVLKKSYTQVLDNVVFGSEVDAEQLKLLVEDSTVLSS